MMFIRVLSNIVNEQKNMIRYKYIDLDSFAMYIKNAREQALLFDDKARLSGLNSCEDMIVFIARNKLGTTFLEHNFRNRCCPDSI